MTKFSSLGVHAFHEWAGDVIDVLNAPVYPKKTERSYSHLKDFMAMISLHRRRHTQSGPQSEKSFLALNRAGGGCMEWKTAGKLYLHNTNVQDRLHRTCEAFAFLSLKSKVKLQPAFIGWDRGRLPNNLSLADLTYKDILYISGRKKAGERATGTERRWDSDTVTEYYALVKTIKEQNTLTRNAPQNTRYDLIEFPDLSPDEVNAHQERTRHLSSSLGSVPTTLTVQAEESGHNLSFMGEAAPSDESDRESDDESDVS